MAQGFIKEYRDARKNLEPFNVLSPGGWQLFGGELTREERDELAASLSDVVALIGLPASPHEGQGDIYHYLPCYNSDGFTKTVRLSGKENTYRRVYDMREQVKKSLDLAYQHGVEHGRKLLQQLATGEITLGQFDAAKARREWEP